MYFQSEWKTVSVLTRWLCKKPADLDLHVFLNRKYTGLAGSK